MDQQSTDEIFIRSCSDQLSVSESNSQLELSETLQNEETVYVCPMLPIDICSNESSNYIDIVSDSYITQTQNTIIQLSEQVSQCPQPIITFNGQMFPLRGVVSF